MPLAAQFDWASVALIAIVAIVLLVIGVEAFVRRDIGQTTADPDAEPAARTGRPARAR